MVTSTVVAKIVYLVYAVTMTTSGSPSFMYFPQPSMDACIQVAAAAKVAVPMGGDAETTVSIFCSTTKGYSK